MFLIQRVTTTGRETSRESTHYFSFLDGLEWKTGKEARLGRAEGKRQGHESVPAKKPKVRESCCQRSLQDSIDVGKLD